MPDADMTLLQTVAQLGDDNKAEQMFIAARWPDGIACPKCGSLDVYESASRPSQPFRCRNCHGYFSVKTGSLMHGSNLSYSKWALAIYLMTSSGKGMSSIRMARDVGVTQKTAWFLMHRVREGWATGDQMFAGPVEVDEAYVAGKERNRHARKKLKSGNMAAKPVVVGMKDRATGKVKTAVVDSPSAANLVDFVHCNVANIFDTPVFTDGNGAYERLSSRHRGVVEHSIGHYVEYVEDGEDIHTNGIEAFWSMLKRGVMGVYHYVSPKHLHRYAVEFAGRHNDKDLGVWDKIRSLASGMFGKRLTYKQLVGRRGHSLLPEHRGMTQSETFRSASSAVIERQRQRDHEEAQAIRRIKVALREIGITPHTDDHTPSHRQPQMSSAEYQKLIMRRFFEGDVPLEPSG